MKALPNYFKTEIWKRLNKYVGRFDSPNLTQQEADKIAEQLTKDCNDLIKEFWDSHKFFMNHDGIIMKAFKISFIKGHGPRIECIPGHPSSEL